jgi:flagellar biosynthetic protein FliQ
MTPDTVNDLLIRALVVGAKVAGPALLITLTVGLIIGVLQAATQINEASISFIAKLLAVMGTIVLMGSWSLRQLMEYTTHTITSIADIVR